MCKKIVLCVQTVCKYKGWIPLKGKSHCDIPIKTGMIHPGTATHTETRGKCEITTYVLIVNACIWEGLEKQNTSCWGQAVRTKEHGTLARKHAPALCCWARPQGSASGLGAVVPAITEGSVEVGRDKGCPKGQAGRDPSCAELSPTRCQPQNAAFSPSAAFPGKEPALH